MWIFLQWDSPRIGKRNRCGDSFLFAVPGVPLPVIQLLVMNPGFFIPNSEGTTTSQYQQLFVFNFMQKTKNIIGNRSISTISLPNPQGEQKERSHEAVRDYFGFNVIYWRFYFSVYLRLFSASFSSRFLRIDHYLLRPEGTNLLEKTLN